MSKKNTKGLKKIEPVDPESKTLEMLTDEEKESLIQEKINDAEKEQKEASEKLKAPVMKSNMDFKNISELITRKGGRMRFKASNVYVKKMEVAAEIETKAGKWKVKKGDYVCLLKNQVIVLNKESHREYLKPIIFG